MSANVHHVHFCSFCKVLDLFTSYSIQQFFKLNQMRCLTGKFVFGGIVNIADRHLTS